MAMQVGIRLFVLFFVMEVFSTWTIVGQVVPINFVGLLMYDLARSHGSMTNAITETSFPTDLAIRGTKSANGKFASLHVNLHINRNAGCIFG